MFTQALGSFFFNIKGNYVDAERDFAAFKRRTESGFQTFARRIGATLAGGAVTAGLVAMSKEAGKFGEKLAQLSMLGVKDLKALEDGAQRVAETYGMDVFDALDAVTELIGSGVPENSAIMILEKAGIGASAAMGTLHEAVDAGVNVMNAYGLQTQDAAENTRRFEEIMGKAAVAVELGRTNLSDIAASLGRVAPTFANAGVSVDELFASVAALTNTGMSASEALNGLRGAVMNIMDPSLMAQKASAELGIEFDAAALKSKGLAGFLKEVKEKLDENLPAMQQEYAHLESTKQALEAKLQTLDRGSREYNKTKQLLNETNRELKNLRAGSGNTTTALTQLFGSVEGLNVILSLTGSQSELFTKALGDMEEPVGILNEMFRAFKENNPQMEMGKFNTALQTLQIEIGQHVIPTLSLLARVLTPVLNGLKWFLDTAPGVANVLGAVAISVAGLATMLAPLGLSWLLAFKPLLNGVKGLLSFGKAARAAGEAGEALATKGGLLRRAFAGAGRAVASVVRAVGGLRNAAAVVSVLTRLGAAVSALGAAAAVAVSPWIAVPIILAAAGLAIWKVGERTYELVKAKERERESLESLQGATDRYIAKLREQGVALDELAMQEMTEDERRRYANEQRIKHREEAAAREIQALTGVQATRDQIHRMELAQIALELDAKQAAAVAASELTAEEIKYLAGKTQAEQQAALARAGVLRVSHQQMLQLEQAAQAARVGTVQQAGQAVVQAEAQNWQERYKLVGMGLNLRLRERDNENLVSGHIIRLKRREGEAEVSKTDWLAVAARQRMAVRRREQQELMALSEEEVAALEAAIPGFAQHYARRIQLGQRFTDMEIASMKKVLDEHKKSKEEKDKTTDQELKSLEKLAGGYDRASSRAVHAVKGAGAAIKEVAQSVHQDLKKFSLDEKGSPSPNELLQRSLERAQRYLDAAARHMEGTIDGLHNHWNAAFRQMGQEAVRTFGLVAQQASTLMQMLARVPAMMGGGVPVGVPAGGVPRFASGGVVPETGPVVTDEAGPELKILPKGTRVVSHRETKMLLADAVETALRGYARDRRTVRAAPPTVVDAVPPTVPAAPFGRSVHGLTAEDVKAAIREAAAEGRKGVSHPPPPVTVAINIEKPQIASEVDVEALSERLYRDFVQQLRARGADFGYVGG